MARKKSPYLTDAELRLMEVIWDKGRATVADVAGSLAKTAPLAYTTVLTTLRILETKGYLRHVKDGRAFLYLPVIGREQARDRALSHLLGRFFGNSAELLVLNLVRGGKIHAKDLKRLRKRIEEEEES